MKVPTFFEGEIITKKQKYIDEIKKSSSPESLSQFHPYLAQASLSVGDSSLFKWKALHFSKGS